ncbi:MAG TPA: glucan biosynthesis protein D, partial [Rhodospirillaceae bacterium]|nr:glucan biosynthesis protein D [Rhodospirillaceae bacterium]
FIGGPLDTMPDDSTVEPVIEARGGRILEPVAVRPVVGTKRWRLTFDFTADEGIDKIELRAYLKHGDKTLSETWITRASIDHS